MIIGFSRVNRKNKILFDASGQVKQVKHINGYLAEADDVFIVNRTSPISDVPKMIFGSMPNDGGFLSNYSKEDRDAIIKQYPNASPFFKKLIGAREFINGQERYALWLDKTNPADWRNIKPIMDAVQAVKENREQSNRASTRKLADTPYLFGEIRQPDSNYLIFPGVSSENRRYIPIDFTSPNVIASNALLIVPAATLYHFGILTSNVHMAWMRTVAGRLKSDYRYSTKVVYNNFPWPSPSEKTKAKIEQTAQAILDARALYPDSSLADLYDELTMPAELRRAHQANDKAVMEAYGFTKVADGKKTWLTESETVEKLFEMYEKITK